MDRGSSYLLSSKIFLILSNCYEIILIFLLSKSNKSQMYMLNTNRPNVKPCATINVIWITVRTVQVYYLLLFFQGKMLKSIENLHLRHIHLVMQLTIDDRYNQTAYWNSWTLEARVGRWNLDAGLWTLDSGQWTLDAGRWTFDTWRVSQRRNDTLIILRTENSADSFFITGKYHTKKQNITSHLKVFFKRATH